MDNLICSVDVVLLTLTGQQLQVGLLRRDHAPFEGVLALPGGYIKPEEDLDTRDAAVRVLREKMGITSPYLEQLGTFSGPARDPRGWSISVAYYALVPPEVITVSGKEDIKLVDVASIRSMPYDHAQIVQAAVERVRGKSAYSSLPAYLCGEHFTLPQLQAVYEAVIGESLNKVSFRRKMAEMELVEPVEGLMEEGTAHRPAQLYRLSAQFRNKLSLWNRGF